MYTLLVLESILQSKLKDRMRHIVALNYTLNYRIRTTDNIIMIIITITYIYIYMKNPPFNSLVWGSLRLAQAQL